MQRAQIIAAVALTASIVLHASVGGGLLYLSESRVEQGGGDTPMEVSIDPTAASGGSGPPIDAGPAGAPPQVAETPPQQTVKSNDPPKDEAKEPPPKEELKDPPPKEEPKEPPPKEEKPQEEKPTTQAAKPPEEPTKETAPSAESEPPPPVIKSAPDTDTPNVVASEPPPPKPEKPKPPAPPKPKPPPPPQQTATAGAAGGASASGRERTRNVGTAVDPGAQLSCVRAIRARLRKPLGLTPRPFMVQIVVAASGAVLLVRTLSSSGSPTIDQEAIRAFRSSGPFPPCPRVGPSISLEVPMINGRR